MRRLLLPMLALLAGIYLCGCNSKDESPDQITPPAGTVAIVDLDAVARRLGRDVEMVSLIETRAGALKDQLEEVQANYVKELTKQRDEFGEERSQEQTEKLLSMQESANLQFNQLRQKAQTHLSQHQQTLIQQYRSEVRPIAQKIAEEKGLNIVMTKNDAVVFSYASAVDITDEVADRMSKLPRTPIAAPAARTATKSNDATK